ncbi:uncharacterized protein LOC111218572 isoform X2 [Seriola dumerili]|uniref:uncharacterized protein LOC111218572 isoform X2 n=1 Tax=Seriola dumerili TaxID=41447 RepID=UPI000BBE621E|nr:uncharacterized protein LOC111218572 isoform X2 [Seriola dumerili]
MFHLKQAALLSIQLLLICHVFAGHYPDEHRNILVSRGDPVMFTCNHDDAGLYRCNVNGADGTSTATWNLTVSEKPEEIIDFHLWYLLYILTTVTGLLLCGITSAVCLCSFISAEYAGPGHQIRIFSQEERMTQRVEETTRGVSTWRGSIQSMVSSELTDHSNET